MDDGSSRVARLVGQLRTLLPCQLTSAADAALVIVTIRKTIELSSQKTTCATLWFYCNWALHAFIKGDDAQPYLKLFDDAIQQWETDPETNVKMSLEDGLTRFLDASLFRQDLERFFTAHQLPSTTFVGGPEWTNSLRWYLALVEQCPLQITPDAEKAKSYKYVRALRVEPLLQRPAEASVDC